MVTEKKYKKEKLHKSILGIALFDVLLVKR